MNLKRSWIIFIVFSLSAILTVITVMRLKKVGRGIEDIRSGYVGIKSNLDDATDPQTINYDKSIADLIRELRQMSTGQLQEKAATATSFDPLNVTHIIDGKPVKLDSGIGSLDGKHVRLENITLNGDWNKDEKTDFAGIISVITEKTTSWYLSVILSGDPHVPLQAKPISEDYPLVTGLAETKSGDISVIETAWKEQKSFIRVFTIGEDGIEEI